MEFPASKLFWVFASPGNFLALLLIVGVFLGMGRDSKRHVFGSTLCFIVALAFFLIGILPIGDWMLMPLENRFPPGKPAHVDGVIMLGGDERPSITEHRKEPSGEDSSQRFVKFASLAREYPQARLVYSGGTLFPAPEQKVSAADVARLALTRLGVPESRMSYEDKSRNTHENAVMSATIVHPEPQQTWLLVTSAWHMTRAMACFRKAGWNVVAAPTGYVTTGVPSTRLEFNLADHLNVMSRAIHEYIGLVAYRFLGYTDTIWPS